LEQKIKLDVEIISKAVKKAAKELDVPYRMIEDQLQFLRFYDNLMETVGNDSELAKHWVYTGNNHLKYTPILRVHKAYYLKQMNEYLEAFRYR
jgi:hypothetical protein